MSNNVKQNNSKNKYMKTFLDGVIYENPIFVLMLGLCPTLAVTTSASNALGMGLSTTAVLVASNVIISALRKIIPDNVRMPAYIVIVASLVTIVQFLMEAYTPDLYESLGIYIPLIVVNCIILGRAEAYASKHSVGLSFIDGIGMGVGFTIALLAIGSVRELLGGGTIFGYQVMPESYEPFNIFVLAPGAFFVMAILAALQNKFKLKSATNVPGNDSDGSCNGNCASCASTTIETDKQNKEGDE